LGQENLAFLTGKFQKRVITDNKSHKPFQMTRKSTLDDLEASVNTHSAMPNVRYCC